MKKKRGPKPKKISRQLKWRKDRLASGCCVQCGEPRGNSKSKRLCEDCLEVDRVRKREELEQDRLFGGAD